MTMQDVHTLTGPYVLAALPDDERAAFAQHLAFCQICADEVAELQEAVTRLSTPVAMKPPTLLRARVLASVDTARQLSPMVAKRNQRGSRRSILALAAAAVVIAVSGGVAIDQHRSRTVASQAGGEVSAVLAEPDARTLHGDVAGGGRATVVMSTRRDTAVVVLRELRPLPARQTYQLWSIDTARTARSIGLVGENLTQVVRRLAGTAEIGLTVEPSGGSAQPTLPAAATISLT
ncbi:anti-sigma factor [Kribbella sp. NPDC056861]|uniref:anti-sigma factor n=1 Tax=Kribbella sp. NPDC056861 TaxID=3154857 RepID=UPI003440B6E6